MTNRRIEYLSLTEIRGAENNPKRHNTAGIERSIERFGVAELPLLDERTGRLVAGHGRINQLRAMRDSGQAPPEGVQAADGDWLVPVTRGWASRSDAEADAYLVASNRLTEMGGWDDAGLHDLLASIGEVDPELVAIAGFDEEDVAALLDSGPKVTELPPALDDPDAVPDVPSKAVTNPGDVWLLGEHRIICGDCRDFETVQRLLGDVRVNVAFTSPPYASQRKYDESSGFRPIPPDEYVDWFEDVQASVRATLAEDGSWFVNIKEHCDEGQRHLYVKDLTIAHVRQWGWRLVDEFAWTRSGVPGTWPNRFKNGWEPVFHYSANPSIRFRPHAVGHESNDVFHEGGRVSGSNRTGNVGWSGSDVQTTAGIALPSNVIEIHTSPATMQGAEHSAAFPVALPAWFIRAYSDPGDIVFDPFMGSGTTLVAAHQEQRVAYGCEISPAYTDVICTRFQRATGVKPVLAATGKPHDFTKLA